VSGFTGASKNYCSRGGGEGGGGRGGIEYDYINMYTQQRDINRYRL
jgi:hypothetical protein